MTFALALAASLFISLGSLAGVVTLFVKPEKLSSILLFLVSLSAGALMGSAFIHLLPEAVESIPPTPLFNTVLVSFVSFFLLEKIFHWRHCHKGVCDVHTFGYMNLVGDTVHNFIDGLIIATTFMADYRLGLITALAIALHEIPQEIGDFGVLLYAGYTRTRALISNFVVALTTPLGVIVGFALAPQLKGLLSYLIPFAVGGFIYISASDLLPEIRKETSQKKSLISFGVFTAGILLMYVTSFLE